MSNKEDVEINLTNEEIRNLFRCGSVKVTFEKKNGDERTLWGTLNQELLKERLMDNYKDYNDDPTKDPEGVVTVYSLDDDGWRRIITEKIKSFEPSEEVQEQLLKMAKEQYGVEE